MRCMSFTLRYGVNCRAAATRTNRSTCSQLTCTAAVHVTSVLEHEVGAGGNDARETANHDGHFTSTNALIAGQQTSRDAGSEPGTLKQRHADEHVERKIKLGVVLRRT